ncbi:MAG TPA: NAD(P)-dependent oxidoreductase, partial [Polyangiaceae bacterium LLY-WYZ-15_(1-7)]|nr:NAD(P)-dependent oxidoreductase [Polyangiaceae bacterium LLY-WYZ-15_(1-7)]
MTAPPRTRREGARILVTGSQGFVGTHLRHALGLRGCECVGVDVPGSGAEIERDLGARDLDPAGLVAEAGAIDAVLYMAARITRGSSVDAEARANLRAIAEAPPRLMEAFLAAGQRPHLVACSTFKMYGPSRPERETAEGAIDPADPPQRPDPHSYGSAKFLAERLLELSAERAGYRFAVVRPSCIYGPGQHAKNAIPRFLAALLEGGRPTVY